MTTAVLITGSNLGDRGANLSAAREMIEREIGVIAAQSPMCESEPWGVMEEGGDLPFLNQVLAVETELEPWELLGATQAIERRLGREGKDDRCDGVVTKGESTDAASGVGGMKGDAGGEGRDSILAEVEACEAAGLKGAGCEGCERCEGAGAKAGRVYRARTMDIDILFYGDRVVDMPLLEIPHPLIAQREFVLNPLSLALPGWRHPVTGRTAAEMLEDLKNR